MKKRFTAQIVGFMRLVIVDDGNQLRSMTARPALAMVTGVQVRVGPR